MITGRIAEGWDPPGPGLRRYVVTFVYQAGGVDLFGEEVDVNATTSIEALDLATEYADETLRPGYVRVDVSSPKVGLY